MRLWAFVWLLAAVDQALPAVSACGIAVHFQLLSRIRENLKPDQQSQATFSLPGAFFPDAFYGCMGQSDSAELAHWPPFLKVAVEYYRDTYQTFDNPDGLGLRSFLFGVLTHQVSDVSWHSLGVDQGLLMAMARREFARDYNSAHNVLDTGGDIVIMQRLLRTSPDLSWLTQRWSIPKRDVRMIYRRMGIEINRPSLEYCMARGLAALNAEISVAPSMYATFAKKSAILMDGLEDYFLGGMQEITASIIQCLPNLEQWFINGPPADPWTLCPVFAGKAPKMSYSVDYSHNSTFEPYIDGMMSKVRQTESNDGLTVYLDLSKFSVAQFATNPGSQLGTQHVFASNQAVGKSLMLSSNIPSSLFGSSFAFGNFRGPNVGPCIAISAPLEYSEESGKQDGSVYVIPLTELDSMFAPSRQFNMLDLNMFRLPLPPQTFLSNLDSQNFTLPRRFGHSMAAITFFNTSILAVSSPGISTIDFYSGPVHLMTILPPSHGTTTRYGAAGRKLFGNQLHVIDADADGISELVVSAPQSDIAKNGREQGEILVLSGRELEFALAKGIPSVAMDIVRLSRLIRPITGENSPGLDELDFGLFGSQIAFSGPFAFIGAAGAGLVYVFNTHSGEILFTLEPHDTTSAKISGFGGGALSAGYIKGLGTWVVIGSPNEPLPEKRTSQAIDSSQEGICYVYLISEDGQHKLLAYLTADSNDASFGKFGYADTKVNGDTGDNILYLSSPFAESGLGAIWKLNIAAIIAKVQDQTDVAVFKFKPLVTGSRASGQVESWFGKSVAAVASSDHVNSHKGYLFVGMPNLGFGNMGTNSKLGAQLIGGVGVYVID
ncbi:zinc dependent phospholipase C-domain-containing protein [Lipomyces japonicus]|uniref:zinc dependent phospholipase C-domain-containing protein n=1 Tax=Lipomyces japonicus TaxID=56871 RepID=UPI0034D00095